MNIPRLRPSTPVRRRVGIIGAGHIVDSAHLPVLLTLPEVEVLWVSDSNPAAARLMEKMFQVPSLPTEAIASALDGVDVCVLAIPLGARSPYLAECASRQVAVYCEKPFARSATQHREICRLFAPEKIGAGFQRRYHAGIQAVRSLLNGGKLGKLREVRLLAGCFDLKSGGPGRFTTDPRLAGGGVVIESRIHELDQILYATMASIVQVERASGICFDGIEYHCETDGKLIRGTESFEVSCIMTRLKNFTSKMEFILESGVLTLGLNADSVPYFNGQAQAISDEFATSIIGGFRYFWETFLDGLSTKTANATSAYSSLGTTTWVEDIYRMMRAKEDPSTRTISRQQLG